MQADTGPFTDLLRTILDHTVDNGIDTEYGGVYVEGPHSGGVYDREKEFWQQAEDTKGKAPKPAAGANPKPVDSNEKD